MENGVLPKDVVVLIARSLVDQTFVMEAFNMLWTCRSVLKRDRILWVAALKILSGSVENFNLPERDYFLDGIKGEYPLPVSLSALACASCLKLQNEPLIDLLPLCLVFLKSEDKLIRAAVQKMTIYDATSVWTGRQVCEWEMMNQIALPRVFRRLYQYVWSGARFCGDVYHFWSLEEVARKRESPKKTLCNLIDVASTTSEKELADLVWKVPVQGVRSVSIESMLAKKNLQEVIWLI